MNKHIPSRRLPRAMQFSAPIDHLASRLLGMAWLAFAMIVPVHAATGAESFSLQPAQSLSLKAPTPVRTETQQPLLPTEVRPQTPPFFDYAENLKSDVFGAHLFTGTFAHKGATQFNPEYAIAVGDSLQVRLWGSFEADALFFVDPQGNVFIPHVGPVKVLGVRNKDLHAAVEAAVRKVFRANVYSYASLAAAQPVRVFVSGFVHRPGLYHGTSMDSLLHFLDQAGGIDPARGSFLNLEVKRGKQVRATVNLYEFLLDGNMPLIQFADGDVIFVSPRQSTVKVGGLAENAKRFEFANNTRTVASLVKLAKPLAAATHVRVVRNTGATRNTEYYPLSAAASVALNNGDELEFTADKKPGSITVRVEGEHLSAQEYVLPYGSRMGDLLKQIEYSERSDKNSVQLFRLGVKERQRKMLEASLKSLETAALTARSGTSDEALLRREEANLLLQWVERAKKIEPAGQVVIAQTDNRNELLLENGDVVRIPTKDGLVLVGGEVLFPTAVAFDRGLGMDDYVRHAGGYTQNADSARIVVAHSDGSYDEAKGGKGFFSSASVVSLRPGDEILVLPKISTKSRQVWKDLTQIIYQIAVSAKVVLDL